MAALHKGGVKDGRVVGAEGAIPFIENLNDAAIKRFQEQCELVNIMESEDLNAIGAKINELKAETRVHSLLTPWSSRSRKLLGCRRGWREVQPMSGELALIHARMKIIERMVTDIGYRDKFAAGSIRARLKVS